LALASQAKAITGKEIYAHGKDNPEQFQYLVGGGKLKNGCQFT